jgi:hypothetical protein
MGIVLEETQRRAMMKRILFTIVCVAGLVITTGWIKTVLTGSPSLAAQETPAPKTTSPDAGDKKPQATSAPSYADITAIISKYHCTVCHGGADPRARLSLDDYKSMMKGSKSSGAVIIPGNPGKSELILRLKGLSEPRMPFTGPPWLSDAEIEMIERWIAAGAKE